MPEVNRTRPIPNGRPAVPVRKPVAGKTSLLSTAIDISDLPDSPVSMLLYGRNGVGKTTWACKFPKPLLLIACEFAKTGGAQSVKRMEGVKYKRLSTVAEVEQIGRELQDDTFYASVVFDSGTSLDEIVLAEKCGWDRPADMLRFGKVTQDQYTERSEHMRKLLYPIINLPDKHKVIICNEKDHNPAESRKSAVIKSRESTDESFFGAAMGGGTARWAMDACDWICQLYVEKETITTTRKVGEGKTQKTVTSVTETGRIVRRLRLKYHPNFAARVRSPMGELKDGLPDYLEEPTWEMIERIQRGE